MTHLYNSFTGQVARKLDPAAGTARGPGACAAGQGVGDLAVDHAFGDIGIFVEKKAATTAAGIPVRGAVVVGMGQVRKQAFQKGLAAAVVLEMAGQVVGNGFPGCRRREVRGQEVHVRGNEFAGIHHRGGQGIGIACRQVQLGHQPGVHMPQGRSAGGAVGQDRVAIMGREAADVGEDILPGAPDFAMEEEGQATATLVRRQEDAVAHAPQYLDHGVAGLLENVVGGAAGEIGHRAHHLSFGLDHFGHLVPERGAIGCGKVLHGDVADAHFPDDALGQGTGADAGRLGGHAQAVFLGQDRPQGLDLLGLAAIDGHLAAHAHEQGVVADPTRAHGRAGAAHQAAL
ncbi:hypothetical protein DESC_580129 [Desulfosarcina cetonica]|nr:hypothetical protein DESC_580129 [Desulfosarcina cetonica]